MRKSTNRKLTRILKKKMHSCGREIKIGKKYKSKIAAAKN